MTAWQRSLRLYGRVVIMTAQEMDVVYIGDDEYDITNWTDEIEFNPGEYGIEAHSFKTSNWRGYHCEYEIADDVLRLRNLSLFNFDGIYPPLNGREATPPEDEYDSEFTYSDVRLPIAFSGVLALGKGDTYCSDFYIHMGTQAMYCWDEVIGIEFDKGRVVRRFSLSDLANRFADEYGESETEEDAGRIHGMCTGSFGFLADVHDDRRLIVDKYYAPKFRKEQAACLDIVRRRLEIGESRGFKADDVFEVQYVPTGCESALVSKDDLMAIVDRMEQGSVVRGDLYGVASLLWWVYRFGFPQISFACSMEQLEEIGSLLEPEYDPTIDNTDDEEEKDRKTFYKASPDKVKKLRRLINEAFRY